MLILIIGLGSIAKKHITALEKLNISCKIYALRSGNSAKSVEGINNIKHFTELPKKPDFAIISNPTSYHKITIEKLLEHNIPMFVEKPALHSLEGIDKLVKSVKNSKLVNYVACNFRFHPCIEFLKNVLPKGNKKINEINVYCGSYLPEWRAGNDFKKNYSSIKELGGGVHLDLIHEIDYIIWLLGEPNLSKSYLSNKSTLNIESNDYANFLLEYNDYSVSIILNYYRRDSKRSIEIIFEDETWFVDLLKSTIINNDGDVIFQSEKFLIQDTYCKQMKYFIEKINSKTFPMNTIEESMIALKIVLQNG